MMQTWTEWAIRFGDGETDPMESEESVRTYIESARASIAKGAVNEDDYEPMTVVRRTVQTTATDWAEVG